MKLTRGALTSALGALAALAWRGGLRSPGWGLAAIGECGALWVPFGLGDAWLWPPR